MLLSDTLVFATNNIHKLDEVNAIFGNRYRIKSLNDIDCYDDIPETADTLEENALMKARYVYNKYKINCFADDTGLEVAALNGAPGVHTARYAGNHDSEANIQKLIRELNNKTDRSAQFRTVIALIINGKEYLFEGIVKGSIATEKRGESGFGYDPIFIPSGGELTFSQMGVDSKNLISHRAIAVEKLYKFLNEK